MTSGVRATVARWVAPGALLVALAACTGQSETLRAEVTSVVEQSGRKLILKNLDREDWRNERIVVHYPRGARHTETRQVVRASSTVKITLQSLQFAALRDSLRIEIATYSDEHPAQEAVAERVELTYTVPQAQSGSQGEARSL